MAEIDRIEFPDGTQQLINDHRIENLEIDSQTLVNGQVLKYDASDNTWKNQDESGGSSSADDVSYDNTSSGLQSTNVQDAIDEVEANIEDTDNPLYHLGFYLDSNGGLCQVNSI